MKPNNITEKIFVKNQYNQLLGSFDSLEYGGIQKPVWVDFGAVLVMSRDTANLVVEKINKQEGKTIAFVVNLSEQ